VRGGRKNQGHQQNVENDTHEFMDHYAPRQGA
jgi:hypothetical protein